MKTGIVREDIYMEHVMDYYHPESPERLKHIYSMLEEIGPENIERIPARDATHEEIAYVHDVSYIESISATKGKSVRLDPDTSTSPKSYEAALKAVGGLLRLIDAVMEGKVDNGFALIRPPGHHAERNRAMGFCLFNNIAIGARYLEKKYNIKRIIIVDFDLHHGNGTQHSFYRDATVLYFSTHQYPYYPGTGWIEETGEGEGRGYTVNVPFSYGMDDDDYMHAFKEVLVPITDMYKPEFILVSAGFDAHYKDPLGGMKVTEKGYAMMTRIMLDLAKKHCNGRIIYALEGGYGLEGLKNSVKAVIQELRGINAFDEYKQDAPSNEAVKIVERLKKTLSPYWGVF
ncbi:MAG TPA: histone deacetylase [Syntrophorhabdaceae bacterium]|nr:histone deacetylase [Syntrophorhabdaceae bacterium]HPU30648.1 histone deacetylase [Syntrophorhabdaceae bacterium]